MSKFEKDPRDSWDAKAYQEALGIVQENGWEHGTETLEKLMNHAEWALDLNPDIRDAIAAEVSFPRQERTEIGGENE